MWREIAEKYPNRYKEFCRLQYGAIRHPIMHDSFQSSWGWILDFFNSKGIYISIWLGTWYGWHYCIQGKDSKMFVNDDIKLHKNKSRPEAQKAACEKAFEILEGI